jgi:hypothetical protein
MQQSRTKAPVPDPPKEAERKAGFFADLWRNFRHLNKADVSRATGYDATTIGRTETVQLKRTLDKLQDMAVACDAGTWAAFGFPPEEGGLIVRALARMTPKQRADYQRSQLEFLRAFL